MKLQGRPLLFLSIGLLVILVLVVGFFSAQGQMDIAVLVGIVAVVLGAIQILYMFLQSRAAPQTGTDSQPKYQPSAQERTNLLSQIRVQWVDGVLKQLLHDQSFIPLGIKQRPDLLQSRTEITVFPLTLPEIIVTPKEVAQVYDQAAGRLLILAQPGGGKTTLLLELAQELVTRAEADATHPIPVILSLSSWNADDTTLAGWMVDELQGRYNVPRPTGQAWVEANLILPLLDGLDEVQQDRQGSCVDAINAHLQGPRVICCRSADYKRIGKKLILNAALKIEPLPTARVLDYLTTQPGIRKLELLTALQADASLMEMAQTPLFFNLMLLTYDGVALDELRKLDNPAARQQRLFSSYVRTRFERREETTKDYSDSETRHYLDWLASQMAIQSLTLLNIEDLQPEWLEYDRKKTYFLHLRLVFGLVGVLVGLAFGLAFGPLLGLVVGLVFGLAFSVVFGRRYQAGVIQMADHITWSWSSYWTALPRKLAFGLVVGVGGGLVFGLIIGLVVGPTVILFLGLVFGVVGGGPVGLLFGLAFGLDDGFSVQSIDKRSTPNEGLEHSRRNVARVLPRYALLFGMALGLVFSMPFSVVGMTREGLVFGLLFGLILGLAGGLPKSGGLAVLQHIILRHQLRRQGVTPWERYDLFLDYAASLRLLVKVGGGYRFMHNLLRDHLAGVTPEDAAEVG